MIPELRNKLIAIGVQVVSGSLLPQHAIESVHNDEWLANLADEDLLALIEETDRYWRHVIETAVNRPENVLIYPELMVAAAEERLKAIGAFRRGIGPADKPAFDERMDRWITMLARSLLAKGMVLLLPPSPQRAWETFTQANLLARALPDMDRMRLRELLWACYGQREAAWLGNQPELAHAAQEEYDHLLHLPGRHAEAQLYNDNIQLEFERIHTLREQRSAGGNEQTPDEPESDDLIHYKGQLNRYAGLILRGTMAPQAARQQLLASLDLAQLTPEAIRTMVVLIHQLVRIEPVRAAALADLNYAVACSLAGAGATFVRGYSAQVLGDALLARARREDDDVDLFHQAIPYLEEAISLLDPSADTDQVSIVAESTQSLAICYRGIGDFKRAKALNEQAIRHYTALPPAPYQLERLAVSYGNLADTQEQLGQPEAALTNHYKALQLFLEIPDVAGARQALFYFTRLCHQTGRIDDAIAALEQTGELLMGLADARATIQTYLLLADSAFRIRRFESGLRILDRVQSLLLPYVSEEDPEPEYLELYYDLLLWDGVVSTMLLNAQAEAFTLDRAYQSLETARVIAVQLGDHDRLAKALVQLAILFEAVDDFEQAEQYCLMVDLVPCSPLHQNRRDEVLGRVRLRQGRYEEAIPLLQQAAAAFGPEHRDIRMSALYRLGEAYAGASKWQEAAQAYESSLDVFEQSRLDLYESSRLEIISNAITIYAQLIRLYADCETDICDPVRALLWLEKSKSRTFIEALGLSDMPLSEVPPAVQADWLEEQRLLERINQLRGRLLFSSSEQFNRLDVQQALFTCLEQLKGIWGRMWPHYPEYVALRQGRIVEWPDIQALLAERAD